MADKYDAVLLKAQTGGKLSDSERYTYEQLTKEHSERGGTARNLRDGKK